MRQKDGAGRTLRSFELAGGALVPTANFPALAPPGAHGGPPRGGSRVAAAAAGAERAHGRSTNRAASKRGMRRKGKAIAEPGRGRGESEPALRAGAAVAPVVVSRMELWPLERLMPLDRNPRTHSDAQIETLAGLISELGFINPVVVDEKGRRILAGNGRYAAAVRLGLEQIPVIPVGHLSPAKQRAYIVADNKIALDSAWDDEILAEYFQAIEGAGESVALTAFGAEEIAEILARVGAEPRPDEERVPAVAKRAVTVRGDVWQLGSHRVLCGDAVSIDDLQLVLDGKAADLVWTDPPYGVDYSTDAGKITNDDLPEREFAALILGALQASHQVMRAGAAIYVAHPDTGGLTFRRCFLEAGFRLSSCLVWVKDALVLSRGDYHWRHEPILYGWKPGAGHRWFGPRDQTTVAKFDSPPFQQVGDDEWQLVLGETTLVIRGRDLTVQALRGSVLFEPRPTSSREHPTMKPVPLIERMLLNSARPGYRVLDPFGGSGSTLIACEGHGLSAHLVEIDPLYADVIVRRWQALTNREATLARSGDPNRGYAGRKAFTFDRVAELRAHDPR